MWLYSCLKHIFVFLFQPDKQLLYKHYEDLKNRPFFPGLIKYMVSGPVVAMVKWLSNNTILFEAARDAVSEHGEDR